MPCSLEHECALQEQGFSFVAGIDEAGRGPLAGPVVAAAVILPLGFAGGELDDSKKLTPSIRSRCYEALMSHPDVVAASAIVEVNDIDRLNILRATHLAMRRAVAALRVIPQHVLIDGLRVNPFPIPQTALVGGDSISLSIAAASVVAKVVRDRLMDGYAAKFPVYGFDKHKGYATPEHLTALRRHGPCPIHRRSFEPVVQMCFDFGEQNPPAVSPTPMRRWRSRRQRDSEDPELGRLDALE